MLLRRFFRRTAAAAAQCGWLPWSRSQRWRSPPPPARAGDERARPSSLRRERQPGSAAGEARQLCSLADFAPRCLHSHGRATRLSAPRWVSALQGASGGKACAFQCFKRQPASRAYLGCSSDDKEPTGSSPDPRCFEPTAGRASPRLCVGSPQNALCGPSWWAIPAPLDSGEALGSLRDSAVTGRAQTLHIRWDVLRVRKCNQPSRDCDWR